MQPAQIIKCIEQAGFDAKVIEATSASAKASCWTPYNSLAQSLLRIFGHQLIARFCIELCFSVQVLKLQVSGMTCTACSSAVEKALLAVSGVEQATVSVALQQAEVHLASTKIEAVRGSQAVH